MTRSPYDVWLFDLDGTLVDIEFAHARRVLGAVGDRIGYDFSDREIERLWHGLGGERNAQLRRWGIDPEPFWAAFHELEDPQRRAEATYLYDDAARLLDTIDAPTGIVTHSQTHLTDPILDSLDLRRYFDVVVCCDDDLGWKPDPAPVERALDGLGVNGDHAGVLVGDSPGDVGAAWNAGLDAVHVERFDHDTRGQCVRADRRVSRLDELLTARLA